MYKKIEAAVDTYGYDILFNMNRVRCSNIVSFYAQLILNTICRMYTISDFYKVTLFFKLNCYKIHYIELSTFKKYLY